MSSEFKVIGVKVPQPLLWGDRVADYLPVLEDGDVLVVTSKIVSIEQNASRSTEEIAVTPEAESLAKKANISPKFAQLIIEESEVLGAVRGAVLSKTEYGLIPNAGIDESNVPDGRYLLLPRKPKEYADELRKTIMEKQGVRIGIVISDSTVVPLRRGTIAFALATSGISAVDSRIGEEDLFGRKLRITTQAMGDSIATAANLAMGEGNEMTPMAIVRGLKIGSESGLSSLMPEDQCVIFAPLHSP